MDTLCRRHQFCSSFLGQVGKNRTNSKEVSDVVKSGDAKTTSLQSKMEIILRDTRVTEKHLQLSGQLSALLGVRTLAEHAHPPRRLTKRFPFTFTHLTTQTISTWMSSVYLCVRCVFLVHTHVGLWNRLTVGPRPLDLC